MHCRARQWSARAWNSWTDKEFIKITSFPTTSCNSDGAAPELNHCKFPKRSRTLQWYSIEISRFDEHVADRYGLVDPTLMAYCYNNSGSTNWVVLQSTLLGEVIGSSRISRVLRWSVDYIHSGRYLFARLLEELIILNLECNIIRPLWSRLKSSLATPSVGCFTLRGRSYIFTINCKELTFAAYQVNVYF